MRGYVVRYVLAAALALTTLAVPGFSDTFDIIMLGHGDSVDPGGSVTVTGGIVTRLSGVPLGNANTGSPVGNVDVSSWEYWDTEWWVSSPADSFLLNLTPDGMLTVSGVINSLGLGSKDDPADLFAILPTTLAVDPGGSADHPAYGLNRDQAAVAGYSPVFLADIGITGPVDVAFEGLAVLMDPTGTNTFTGESSELTLEITQVPEPDTWLSLGIGLAGVALLAVWRPRADGGGRGIRKV